ncbi:cell wall hydrolase [Caulobacter sp. KR2-114]|uniref:cell wall hydrolase n=1 Tax=Caulobacter sp. KR2-114 TaxID=3400912 RepID=UPI003C07DFB1
MLGVVLAAPAPAALAAETAGIRLLIGGADAQVVQAAPVVRLGPADADWSASDRLDPATCLAQAIYYEARSESIEGQEGVAQVVMNRTRLAAYPADVCGVVFQRSDRGTCQFTFACDGSMDRPIDPVAWDRAHDLAVKALHGFVYRPLAGATHYHAAWMTPYWSGSLVRVRQIGGHIFYR